MDRVRHHGWMVADEQVRTVSEGAAVPTESLNSSEKDQRRGVRLSLASPRGQTSCNAYDTVHLAEHHDGDHIQMMVTHLPTTAVAIS